MSNENDDLEQKAVEEAGQAVPEEAAEPAAEEQPQACGDAVAGGPDEPNPQGPGEAAPEDEPEAEKRPLSGREKLLAIVAAVALVAALVFCGLFATSCVPSSRAASFDGGTIAEEDVAAWIEQQRGAYGFTDDTTFAQALSSQGMTVASYRQNAIDQLVIKELIEQHAKADGITVSDEEVEERLASVYGQVSDGDDSLWLQTLESMGVTEDDLRVRYRADILQSKVLEAEVPVEDAADDEVLDYVGNYLADTTQKKVYCIAFSSDEGKTSKASACIAELKALKKGGKLDAVAFEEIALKYSEAEDVQDTKGSLGWTGSGSMTTDVSEIVEDLDAGEFSEAATIDDDSTLGIVFVSEEYTFPELSEIVSIEAMETPDELLELVKSAAAQAAWSSDCSAYLAKLLADAQVTYYPVPSDASYNVDLSQL